jgi:preprotein translocase subunit SecD
MWRAAGVARFLVGLALTLILLAQNGAGQQAASRALTLRQIEDLVSLGVPDSAVHTEIQKRGLAFTPTPALLASLRARGAGPMALADIEAAIPKAPQRQVRGGRFWSLVLEVQVQDATKQAADRTIDDLKTQMRTWHLDWASLDRNDPQTVAEAANVQINVHGISAAGRQEFEHRIGAALGEWRLATASADSYRLNLRPEAFYRLRESAVDGVVETLRRRVEALGLKEAEIRRDNAENGCCNVACRYPPVIEPARLKQMLFAVGELRLFKVKEGPFRSQDEALRAHGGVLLLGTMLKYQANGSGQGWYLLDRDSIATTRDLRDARPIRAGNGTWLLACWFKEKGANTLAHLEQASPGSSLAVVLDGRVWGIQKVEPQITERFDIRGFEQEQTAADLALLLRSGELPAGTVAVRETSGYQ